jgi:hypothetical protein
LQKQEARARSTKQNIRKGGGGRKGKIGEVGNGEKMQGIVDLFWCFWSFSSQVVQEGVAVSRVEWASESSVEKEKKSVE